MRVKYGKDSKWEDTSGMKVINAVVREDEKE